MKINLRKYRLLLSEFGCRHGYSAHTHRMAAQRAYGAVQAFYIVNLFYAYQTMYMLMDNYSDAHGLTINALWPVWFVSSGYITLAANVFSLSYMAFSLIAAFNASHRLTRFMVFISALQVFAFKYSFGPLPEKEHMWIWVSLLFVFLPSSSSSALYNCRNSRQSYLDVFATVQGMVLFFYSLSGLWKIAFGIAAAGTDNATGMFYPETLALMVSNLMIHEHYETFLGPLLLAYPAWGSILYLLVVYIETCALLIWFKPSLHKLWALLIILFHIGTWLLMGIPFYMQPALLAILLFQSPFAREHYTWHYITSQLPLIGFLFRRHVNQRQSQ